MSATTTATISPAPRIASRVLKKDEPRAGSNRAKWAVRLALCGVLTLFAARAGLVAWNDSITPDETTHLQHTLRFWLTGDDKGIWELGAPRLPHIVAAFPAYAALAVSGHLPAVDDNLDEKIANLVLGGSARVLRPARCAGIVWGAGLIALIYWVVARRRGAFVGLIAATFASMVPELIAHSAIAGSDVPFTCSAFLAIALLADHFDRPTLKSWLFASLAVGLAWATRHSALLLIGLAGAVHLASNVKQKRPREFASWAECFLGSALAVALLCTIAFGVLWAGDGFGAIALGRVSASVPSRLGPIALTSLPVPTSALSVLKQIRHQNAGHEAFFLGEVRSSGWPTYFPVAFLLKTPTGLLALMVLAAARLRPKNAWDGICLACLSLLWIMLVRNKVNIGVRYALLTYPLAIPWVARLFEPKLLRDRVWGPLTLAAAVWFGVASIGCGSRYLSYFNEIGGGAERGWMYLADSNNDWGQDLDALGETLKRLNIVEVTADVSTEKRLNVPGIFIAVNPARDFQPPVETPKNRRLYDSEAGYSPVFTRHVAVSVSRLHGLYSQNDMSWLRTRKLVARVRDTIFLFDMDEPADRPFCP